MALLEIIARPADAGAVRDEFQRFLEHARRDGRNDLKVLFGYHWGLQRYQKDWIEELMTAEELAQAVEAAESAQKGRIGNDDLHVSVISLGVEYTFCHEADIHLVGPEGSAYMEAESARYGALGWSVTKRMKDTEPSSGGNR